MLSPIEVLNSNIHTCKQHNNTLMEHIHSKVTIKAETMWSELFTVNGNHKLIITINIEY